MLPPDSFPRAVLSDLSHPGGRWVSIVPLVTAVVSLGLLFLAIVFGWFGEWTHAGSRFCEASRPGLIKQPVNTWSNLGFVFVGLGIARHLRRGTWGRNINALTRNRFYAAFFASLVVFLGPCSMAMHATETQIGSYLDGLSMYLIAAFINAYAVQRFYRLQPVAFVIVFAVLLATCLFLQRLPVRVPILGFVGNLVFGILIVSGTVFELLNSFVRKMDHQFWWGALSSLSIILAFVIWNVSLTGCPLCDPYSVIQGHAVWHLLCAVSLYCLFRYYVSENPEAKAR